VNHANLSKSDSNGSGVGGMVSLDGQTVELEFAAPEGYRGNNYWNIDDIQFSNVPVPEPAAWFLWTAGGFGLAFSRWRRRK